MFYKKWFCLLTVLSIIGVSSEEHTVMGSYDFVFNSCGLKSFQPTEAPTPQPPPVSNRISDTIEAGEGEAPWMALIEVMPTPFSINFCGGALINNRFVLTSSLCVLNNFTKHVVLGSKTDNSTYNVSNVISNGNVALLKISHRIIARTDSMSSHYVVNGVCVPQKQIINDVKENATIWSYGFSDNNNTLYNLRSKQIKMYSKTNCTDEEVCVDDHNLICYGDIGSPLIQTDWSENRAVLIGIAQSVNATAHGCGSEVIRFSRVSFFTDWIQQTIDSSPHDNVTDDSISSSPTTDSMDITTEDMSEVTIEVNEDTTEGITKDYNLPTIDNNNEYEPKPLLRPKAQEKEEDNVVSNTRWALRLLFLAFLVVLLFIAFLNTFSFYKIYKIGQQLKKLRENDISNIKT